MCPVEEQDCSKMQNLNKVILEKQVFKRRDLSKEIFTEKGRRHGESLLGRCLLLGVIVEADLTKDLYKIGSNIVALNLWSKATQFNIRIEGTANILVVPSVNFH